MAQQLRIMPRMKTLTCLETCCHHLCYVETLVQQEARHRYPDHHHHHPLHDPGPQDSTWIACVDRMVLDGACLTSALLPGGMRFWLSRSGFMTDVALELLSLTGLGMTHIHWLDIK